MLRGEVQNFRERTEKSDNPFAPLNTNLVVWTFNLVRYEEGEPLPPIPVEIRGQNISGFVNNGDTVALLEEWNGQGLHRPKRVFNLTTGVEVRTK
jgi:hypothetical protein